MKIGVLITTFGPLDPVAYHNHLSVLLSWKKLFDLEAYHLSDNQQEASLNAMVNIALQDGCTHLFFIEHDNILSKKDLPKLLKHNLDIVSGYYTFRNWPFAPIPVKRDTETGLYYRLEYVAEYEEGKDNLIEVDVACFGCCLIKAEVMKKLFDAGKIFRREQSIKGNTTMTVDCVLFDDLRKAGYKLFVDGNVRVGHLAQRFVVTPDNYRLYREMVKLVFPEIVPKEEQFSEEKRKQICEFLGERA